MTSYELLFVVPGTFAETEVIPLVDKVHDLVKEIGAEQIEMKVLGKNKLSYPMKHIRYGYFHLCRFDADPKSIPSLQGKLRLVSELLRAIIKTYNKGKDIADIIEKKEQEVPVIAPVSEDFSLPESREAPKRVVKRKTEEKTEEDKKVSIEDIDKKLDEILDQDMAHV